MVDLHYYLTLSLRLRRQAARTPEQDSAHDLFIDSAEAIEELAESARSYSAALSDAGWSANMDRQGGA